MSNLEMREVMLKKNILLQRLESEKISYDEYKTAITKLNKDLKSTTNRSKNDRNTLNAFRKTLVK